MRFRSIQILRCLAAASVTLFHAAQWSHVDVAVGAAGVDVFFVISGFVLWTAADARPVGPGRFLLARAARVAPLYWLATLTVAALALWRPAILPIIHPDLRHLILSLLFLPHTGPGGDPFPLLPTGWTLTYEALFYVLFAIALACPKDRRWQVLALSLLAASILGFGYHGWYTLLANPLLLEFVGGVWLARLWSGGRLQKLTGRAGLGLISAGLLVLLACQVGGLRDDFLRPFVWGPPAVAIVAGALVLEARGNAGGGALTRALVGGGDASYSLYLVQGPLIAAFAALTPAWPAAVRLPAGFALALIGGWLCFVLVERPLGRLSRLPGAQRHRRRGLGLAPQEPLAVVDPDVP